MGCMIAWTRKFTAPSTGMRSPLCFSGTRDTPVPQMGCISQRLHLTPPPRTHTARFAPTLSRMYSSQPRPLLLRGVEVFLMAKHRQQGKGGTRQGYSLNSATTRSSGNSSEGVVLVRQEQPTWVETVASPLASPMAFVGERVAFVCRATRLRETELTAEMMLVSCRVCS